MKKIKFSKSEIDSLDTIIDFCNSLEEGMVLKSIVNKLEKLRDKIEDLK